jgi:hypothetical protein
LYNGIEQFPDYDVVRLSDLFEKPQDLGMPDKSFPMLELEVKVININEGRNEEIVNRCKKLSEYSAFIAKTRSYWEELGNLEDAIKETVKYCHKHGILKEYLENYGSEVLGMLYTEWNLDDALAVAREEEREDVARSALAEGLSPELVQKITGLDVDTIISLK